MKTCKFKVGDRIAYSAAFLKSIGARASKEDIGGLRGTVKSVQEFVPGKWLVKFVWDGGEESSALATNLAKVGANIDFCAC